MINAAAAGTWRLGDRTVHRMGFGAMRLTGSAAFDAGRPSTGNPEHLDDNIAAGALRLTDDEFAALDAL